MKTTALAAFLVLTFAAAAAADPAPAPAAPSPAQLDRDLQAFAEQLRSAQETLADLQKRLETVEDRLGENLQPPSPFNNIERRLDDLEDAVDELKRR